ncbi:hypothetical protein ACF0H5_011635 [Mactra antiquata]
MSTDKGCCSCIRDNGSVATSATGTTSECICDQIGEHHEKVKHLWRKLQTMGRKLKNEPPSDESTTSSSDTYDDNAPDGGWGWMVCFGSFLLNFILDGTMFSFGVLLLELLDYFGEGKAKTSWIGSSLLGMSMFLGPVVSTLLEKFSCRQITIAGTLVSVCAFIVSVFSPNVEMLILTYGIIGGVGFCMTFVSAIIVVGLYFNRKRAIATGIAMSGSGLGTFAYAYLTNFLITTFDWRGTILILSGILLNGVVCGLLFRPLLPSNFSGSRSESVSRDSNGVSDPAERKTLIPKLDKTQVNYLKTSALPTRLTMSTDIMRVQNDLALESKCFSSQSDCRRREFVTITNQMSKKDIFYSGSLKRLPNHHDSQILLPHTVKFSSCTMDDTSIGKEKSTLKSIIDTFTCNLELFKDKVFILLLLTNVCWTVQSVPVTYIPDLGVSKNLPKQQAAMLISIVGVTNIIGRILSGIITDVFQVRSSVTYTFALFTASIVNFLMPWCETFVTLAVCGAIFGLCMATAVSMRTIVIADHLGIEKLTRAFGMVALFQGIAFMTNAPLAGFLYETFQSYVMPFSFAGVMYFLSGLFCVAVQCVNHDCKESVIEVFVSDRNDTSETKTKSGS